MTVLPMEQAELIRQWAMQQVGSPYVYGATGGLCTPAMRRDKQGQYPQHKDTIAQYCPVLRMDQNNCVNCPNAGKAAYDCAQLVRRALEVAGIRPPSGSNSQWRAPVWSYKGELDPRAAATLCVVFRSNGEKNNPMQHVGLSLGNGRVVDARSHRTGVVISGIGDYPWTHFALPAALNPPKDSVIRPGDAGERVKALQALLMAAGHPLPRYGADGKYGEETAQALKAFQERLGLTVQPWADDTLMARLQTAPPATPTVEERLQALERDMLLCRKARAS